MPAKGARTLFSTGVCSPRAVHHPTTLPRLKHICRRGSWCSKPDAAAVAASDDQKITTHNCTEVGQASGMVLVMQLYVRRGVDVVVRCVTL